MKWLNQSDFSLLHPGPGSLYGVNDLTRRYSTGLTDGKPLRRDGTGFMR